MYSLCVIALIIITSDWFEKNNDSRTPQLFYYGVIFFTGAIRAFVGPATNAIIAQLVPRNVLHFAANISSSTFLIASISGHASAGFFIAWFGVHISFYIILVYVLIASLLISFITKKPIMALPNKEGTWKSVKEGLHFVYNNKIMLGAISLDLFAVLFGGVVALIPEFAEKILQVGPIGFGWLNAAMDIGSMIIIISLTIWPMRAKQGYRLFFAVASFGICIILFGFSRIYWISFLILLLAGMADGISVIIRNTIIQLTTPDDKRGRVASVNSMFINSSNELGQFESGFMTKAIGAVPAVLFGGTMTLLVVIITWFKAKELKKFEY